MPVAVRLHQLLAAAADTPDADLLARFATTRDEPAFAELVRRHGPTVHRVCRRVAGPAHADDAFQATFLVLALRAKAVRKAASVACWLVGVAGRVARQMNRGELRRLRRETAHAAVRPPDADAPHPLELSELAAALDDELTRLPDALRGPVVLCLLRGRTHDQAAAELGSSPRTVRRRLDQAKAALRARLEGRGVVPAVAGVLVAAAGDGLAAVPPALARGAVAGVFDFLGGGAVTPAAAVAKGVAGAMTGFQLKAAGAAAVAVVLAGLGVGWAGGDRDRPAAIPPQNLPTAPAPKPVAATPDAPVERPGPGHATRNFAVEAPTAEIARAVAAEAEHQRKRVAELWLGKELPPWPKPHPIKVSITPGNAGGASVFTFGKDADGKPTLSSSETDLRGEFRQVLSTHLPHEVTHVVLAHHFRQPVPRWADEGIAELSEPHTEQTNLDEKCRELLNAGRGIRLRVLFGLKEYPKDVATLYAQGHSVCRFLLTRPLTDHVPADPLREGQGRNTRPAPRNGRHELLRFLAAGLETDWARAAKEVYWFDSLDNLEASWLTWLGTPESKPKPEVAAPRPPAKADDPDLIPPANLPRGEKSGRAWPFPSRRLRFPAAPALAGRTDLRALELYVSRDGGRAWQLADVMPAHRDFFTYTAPADGDYLFKTVAVRADGRREPPDLASAPPDQRVWVATAPARPGGPALAAEPACEPLPKL